MMTRFSLCAGLAAVVCALCSTLPMTTAQTSDVSIMQTLYQLHQMQNAYYLQYQQIASTAQSSSVVSVLQQIQADEATAIQRLSVPLQANNGLINTCYKFTGLTNITTSGQTYLQYAAMFANATSNIYPTAIQNITTKSYLPLLLALGQEESQHASFLYGQVNGNYFTGRLVANTTTTPFLPLSSATTLLKQYASNCNNSAAVTATISQQASANSAVPSAANGNSSPNNNPANNANAPGGNAPPRARAASGKLYHLH